MDNTLPASVTIGPFTYSISQDADSHMREEHESRTKVDGCIRWIERDILVRPGLDGIYAASVLLHEVLHGCNELAGVFTGDGEEERIVTSLAPILLDTLRRNPEFVACLLGEGG
jgi:hypothetical protein